MEVRQPGGDILFLLCLIFFFTHCHSDDCHGEMITVYRVAEHTFKTIKFFALCFLGCITMPITTVCLASLSKWLCPLNDYM